MSVGATPRKLICEAGEASGVPGNGNTANAGVLEVPAPLVLPELLHEARPRLQTDSQGQGEYDAHADKHDALHEKPLPDDRTCCAPKTHSTHVFGARGGEKACKSQNLRMICTSPQPVALPISLPKERRNWERSLLDSGRGLSAGSLERHEPGYAVDLPRNTHYCPGATGPI